MADSARDPRHARHTSRPSVEPFDEVVSRALRILDEESRAWTESPERLDTARMRRAHPATLTNSESR
jgi:hypothetical protein